AKMSSPSKRASPAVGRSRRSSSRASVDFPQPDSPTSPSVSPRATSKLTPSTARTAPVARPKTDPPPSGKSLVSLTAWSTGAATGGMGSAADTADLLRPPAGGRPADRLRRRLDGSGRRGGRKRGGGG